MTIPEGHVVFLLGAGASRDAGFPLVDGLTCKLRESLPYVTDLNSEVRHEFPKLLDAVARIDPKAKKNYELFIACLELMTPKPGKPSQDLFSFNLEERLVEAAPYLMDSVAQPIVKELQRCHLDYEPSYLARLGDFVPPDGRLKVFTLNYDLCVEKAFQNQDLEITTGFDRDTRRWAPYLFCTGRPGINLYKLHGSLNWTLDDTLEDQPVIENYSSSLKNPPIWEPGAQIALGPGLKLQTDDPFVTMYYEFHQALRKAKVCVTVGFKYQDWHIAGPLSEAMKRGLTVVDVRPDAKLREGHGWILSNARSAFENGTILECSSISSLRRSVGS